MTTNRRPNGIKPKKQVNELIQGFICIITTTLFAILPIVLLSLTGAVKIEMEGGTVFIIFISLCSVLAGGLLFYAFYRRRKSSAQIIENAVNRILKGEYDISVDGLDGDYKKVGDCLSTVAKRLKQAEKEKDDFINDFSHELKTPIVSIRGFARLIAKGNLEKSEEKEYLSIIVSESDRLVDLTASTLMLDRISNNKLEIEKKKYNLSEQIRKTVLLLQNEWEKKNINFIADLGEYEIYSNEELVSRLLLNVIQNAVKFSNPNGKIEITAYKTDKSVCVCIKDEGIGMNEETQRRMFDKYFRGDKSRSSQGNGLGLATVKKIADLLDIELKVNSKLGEGTAFTVIFKN